MRKLARQTLAITILSLVTTIVLTSCGTPLCIGGVGECGWDPGKNKGQQSALTITPASDSMAVGETNQIRARGGTGPYTYSITSPPPSALSGWIDARSGMYTAPLNLGGYRSQDVIIKAIDANGAWGQYTIHVTAG